MTTPHTAAQRNAFLVAAHHRLVCVPVEFVGVGKDGHYESRYDLAPALGGEGCVCHGQPLRVSRDGRS